MKLNKNKIIVSALALAIGGSLAGSVGSTIAWYQYSTRANVSFIGESSGFSGNLQMRFAGENDNQWRTRITWQEMAAKLAANHYAEKVVPMTFGGIGREADISNASGYIQPLLGKPNMSDWIAASNKNFAQFELQLRYNERDGVKEGDENNQKDEKNVEKKVYLSQLLIQEDANNAHNNKSDLSDAIRVHVASSYKELNMSDPEHPVLGDQQTKNKLISKLGGATLTQGTLDLDNDGQPDQAYPDGDEFGFDYLRNDQDEIIYNDQTGEPTRVGLHDVVYGDGAQISYAAKSTYTQQDADNEYLPYGKSAGQEVAAPIYPALAGSTGNKLDNLDYDDDFDVDTPKVDKYIGSTIEAENEFLTVTVTIWVEGWQELDESAIWDEVKYVDSSFNVGIQFAVEDAEL